MKKKILIGFNKKKINLDVEDCNLWQKFAGLMFSSREKAKILLFDMGLEQRIAIHSFFVFFPFLAVWLDDKNTVVEIKKVEPFTSCVIPKKLTFKLIEIPINTENKKILAFFQ